MGFRGRVQAVILNSTPKAGAAVSIKGLCRTLRVHVPAQSELTALPLWLISVNTTLCAPTTELWLQARLWGVVAQIHFAQSLCWAEVGSE